MLFLHIAMMEEKMSFTNSLGRWGGAFNLMQALAYLAAGGAALFIPLERIRDDTAAFAAFYNAMPAPFIVLSLALITLGVLGLTAVVPATAALLDEKQSAWITIGKNIAFLSLAVIVVYYTWFLSTVGSLAAAYATAAPELRAAIAVDDPHAPANWVTWFIFGGMGFWVVIVGAAGWIGGALPKSFAIACAIKTGGFWVALAGIVLGDMMLAQVGVVLGVLVGGPLYHAWLGLLMLRARGHES